MLPNLKDKYFITKNKLYTFFEKNSKRTHKATQYFVLNLFLKRGLKNCRTEWLEEDSSNHENDNCCYISLSLMRPRVIIRAGESVRSN